MNPLDYAIWPIIGRESNAQAHASIESLKPAISQAFDNLDQHVINKAIDDWPRRLDAVIAAKGGYFE